MSELESLALLIADLNTQVRVLQVRNSELEKALKDKSTSETPADI